MKLLFALCFASATVLLSHVHFRGDYANIFQLHLNILWNSRREMTRSPPDWFIVYSMRSNANACK